MSWIKDYIGLADTMVKLSDIERIMKEVPTNTKEYLHLNSIVEIFKQLPKGAEVLIEFTASQWKRLRKMDFVHEEQTSKFTQPQFDIDAPDKGRIEQYWVKHGIKIYTRQKLSKRFPINIVQNLWNPEFLINLYKLKGIEFGNWTSQEDRHNYCFALGLGCYDLAQVTGFELPQIGFNGVLSLSIGARGKGGHAVAHYEPNYKVINITRYGRKNAKLLKEAEITERRSETIKYAEGVKSLAHEWGHALDYIVGGLIAPNSPLSRGSLVSSQYINEKEPARKLMEKILNHLYLNKDNTESSAFVKRLVKTVGVENDYWFRRNEIFARSFEKYVHTKLKLKGFNNVYLTQLKYSKSLYPTDNEIRELIPLFDNLMIECKKILSKKYKTKSETPIPIQEKNLTGITDGIKKPKKVTKETEKITLRGGVINSELVAQLHFDVYKFTGKFRELVGQPEKGFSMMIYGQPKNGKSYFCFILAKYLAKNFGRVLYIAKEEGLGQTIQDKINQTGAKQKNLDFLFPTGIDSKVEATLKEGDYNFVIVDSFSEMNWTNAYFEELKQKFPEISFIIVVQCTKNGSFLGEQKIEHNQDIIVKIQNRAATSRGRFGSTIEPILVSDLNP